MTYDIIIRDIAFYVFIAVYALELYNVLILKDVPNIRTAPAIRKKMIELLKEDFKKRKKKSYTIIDLGSGNGLLTREIAKALPKAKVIGIERIKHTCLWAKWQKRRAKLNNLDYINMDFMSYDLSKTSAITMYMVPYMMKKLSKKLQKEARPGTLILCNKFKLFDGWEPIETLRIKTLYFHQKALHIYRKS